MKKIQIGDFKFSEKDKEVINEIVKSERITEHKQTRDFEKNWANVIGTKYSIAVNSGTSALISGLMALKYFVNDKKRIKVITTPLTYIATSNAIKLCGLEPVYCDINKRTFGIEPSGIKKILNENNPNEFLAILPVHLMGYPCEIDEIIDMAKKNNLFVLEDSAQAHGTKYKNKIVGSLGDMSFYSFYIAHNIQAGELGSVNTNNRDLRNLVRQIKSNGRMCLCDVCKRSENKCPEILKYEKQGGIEDFEPRFTHNLIGFNFRTNEFSTALANVKLKELDKINSMRRKNVKYLNKGLERYSDILQLPIYSEDISYLGYPIVVKKGSRKDIRRKLEERGIETRILFGCIPTQQPSYKDLNQEYEGKLPNAEYVGKNGFYIGIHQFLSKDDLDYIIKNFEEVLK